MVPIIKDRVDKSTSHHLKNDKSSMKLLEGPKAATRRETG